MTMHILSKIYEIVIVPVIHILDTNTGKSLINQ